jgi:hypothetical protein
MKHFTAWMAAAILAASAGMAAGQAKFHGVELPDPKRYNAHFGDIDKSGDRLVNWEEFKAFFPQAEPKVFDAIDLDQSRAIDHDEWHKFKEAHGLKHQD